MCCTAVYRVSRMKGVVRVTTDISDYIAYKDKENGMMVTERVLEINDFYIG